MPLGVVLLVCTVTVLVALLDPPKLTEAGLKLQVEFDGSPVHESDTNPAKPLNGVKVNL